jgi:hypothetical protein
MRERIVARANGRNAVSFEDSMKYISNGLVSVGAVAAAPLFLPGVSLITRPVLKTAIRGYLAAADAFGSPGDWFRDASERTDELLASAREQLTDLVAEAKAEREQALRRATHEAHDAHEEEASAPKKRGHHARAEAKS